MTTSNEVSYTAFITIRLPGRQEPAQIQVLLTPADPVALVNGQVKPLRDCTLGELQQFADELESDLWAGYRSRTVVQLMEQEGEAVSITVLDDEGQQLPLSDDLLDRALIVETEASPPPGVESELQEASESPAPDVAATQTDEETAPGQPAPVDEELAPVQDLPEPVATEEAPPPAESVAQVETPAEIVEQPAIVEKPRVRILGRRRPLDHPTWTAVDILMNEPAFRDAQAHAIGSPDREVAGVLIGPPPEKQPDNRYLVHVSDIIIAKHTKMHGASVTYTPESWRYLHDRLSELYPDESAMIVGWYHTHPGFGIFLSSMDQFIHHNFFTQIWHIALVLDPLAKVSGFFCWDRQQTRVDAYEFPWPHWAANSW